LNPKSQLKLTTAFDLGKGYIQEQYDPRFKGSITLRNKLALNMFKTANCQFSYSDINGL